MIELHLVVTTRVKCLSTLTGSCGKSVLSLGPVLYIPILYNVSFSLCRKAQAGTRTGMNSEVQMIRHDNLFQ